MSMATLHIPDPTTPLEMRLARSEADLLAAQRLRYKVFVEEFGSTGAMVDHGARLERDAFDPHFDHLLLIDPGRNAAALDHVVGAYRLLPGARAARAGGFYSASEYDLSPLIASGRRLLELGRTCVHPDYRGGMALLQLWSGLAQYVLDNGVEVMFGVASFPGTDLQALREPLAWLHHWHMAPPALRPRARPEVFEPMDLLARAEVDPRRAAAATPPLIRAYLRMGGHVGEGAFVDHAFRTVDVCLVLDTATMPVAQRGFHTRAAAAQR